MGRTARAGREEYAVTFATNNDHSLLKAIVSIIRRIIVSVSNFFFLMYVCAALCISLHTFPFKNVP